MRITDDATIATMLAVFVARACGHVGGTQYALGRAVAEVARGLSRADRPAAAAPPGQCSRADVGCVT